MNKWSALCIVSFFSVAALWSSLEAASPRVGVGANYWVALDDIDTDDFDEDGLSYYVTAQLPLGDLLKLDLQLERFEEGFAGSDEDVYSPQAYLLLGSSLYAGVGAGIYYADSEFSDTPYYGLRAGFSLELLPNILIDINANYRFEDWGGLNDEDIDEDTLMLGAAARIEL